MNAGSITISTELDNKELEREYTATVKKIQRLTDKINTAQAKRSPAADQSAAIAAELDAAKAQLDYMKSGQEFFTSGAIQQQEASVKSIQKDWNAAQTSVEKYDAQISSASTELSANEEKASAIASEMADAGAKTSLMGDGLDAVGVRLDKVLTRIKKLATRILFFSVITMGLRSVREWLGSVVEANGEASQAVARLKGALLTLAQPLVNVVIPAFTSFVRILTQVVLGIARVISILSGTTVEQSEKSAQALNGETTALDKTGKAAKKAAKSLASFDEINQLSSSDSDTSGSAASGAASPDFAGLQGFNTKEYKEKIDEITTYISGALLALGAILLFSGANIPLGLGLVSLGAVGLAAEIKENWNAMPDKVKQALTGVFSAVGGVLLGLGAILCFSGVNVPLGIGIMAAGAVGLAAAAGLNWDSTSNKVKTVLQILEFAVGGAMLALGAMLCLSGSSVPLGLAFLAAGAVSLITAEALNWDSMPNKIKSVLAVIAGAIGGALLALGALLAFTGVAVPLGIALMIAGAVSLATAATLSWDSTSNKVAAVVKTILAAVSGALLVLGALFLFSGANAPLGIGLLLAGGAGLAAASLLNWDYVLNKLSGAWNNIKSWWKTDVMPKLLSIPAWFKDNLINPLIGFAESFVNFFIDGINDIIGAINTMIQLASSALGVVGITVDAPQIPNIDRIALPRLATGAVIPPNREFMAVLGDQKHGTNIEAPEELLRQMANDAAGANADILREIRDAIRAGKILMLDRRELGRAVVDVYGQESRRVGVSLL